MYNFKEKLQTVNYTKDKKGKPILIVPKYIILHHTGNNGLQGNLNILLGKVKTDNPVSAHFLVNINGDSYKLSEPTYCCWHAGTSTWGKLVNLNGHSIGIEIVGPPFTDIQRDEVKKLVEHLMSAFNIPKENILRHKDISPGRKVDVADEFRNNKYKTYKDYQDSLVPKLQ